MVHKWHKRFTDSKASTKDNERVDRPTLTDKRALTLVREVIDTDRRLTDRDTVEMCNLKEDRLAVYFQSGCTDIRSVFGEAAKRFKMNRDLQKR